MHALQINYNAQSSKRLVYMTACEVGAWPKIMVSMVSVIFGRGVCINAAWLEAGAYERTALCSHQSSSYFAYV